MTAVRIAERVASLGLPGSSTEPIAVDAEVGAALLAELSRHRVLGLFVRGVEAGLIHADDSVVHQAVGMHDAVMSQTMRIEIAAIHASTLFTDAGIDHRLLKGSALAHTCATSPSDRSFRDVDVLVGAGDISKAVHLLIGQGAVRLQPELRLGYDQRFAKSVTMRLNDVEIDLHRTLCPGPFGVWMRPDDLFVLKQNMSLGGVSIPTLDRTDHLLHACYHAALGQVDPVLSNLRDVALLATSDADVPGGSGTRYDAERFDGTVARWRGRAVIRRAVGLVNGRLDVEMPESLGEYLHELVDASELAAIDPYLADDHDGRFAALAPSTLRALPMSDRAAYALAVGLPDGTRPSDRALSLLARRRQR